MFQSKTKAVIFLFLLLSYVNGITQDITQTIRGTILDTETKIPQLAATVAIYDGPVLVTASITDTDGNFRFDNVPVGRYSVVCSFIGYRQVLIPDVIVGAGKEVVLPVEMEESAVEIDDVTILNNVFLTLEADFPGGLEGFFVAKLLKIVKTKSLGPYEPAPDVRMHFTGCVKSSSALLYRPGTQLT